MEDGRRGRARRARWFPLLAAVAFEALLVSPADAGGDRPGRFYLYFEPGLYFVTDDRLPADIHIDTADGLNLVLAGGAGYSISEHWGVELQVHGTEPDLHQGGRKIREYSNITIVPAVRFRWPLDDERRFVPWVTAGVGGSVTDINETGDPDIVIETDQWNIVGTLAVGLDWFVADDVAIGGSLHGFIHPRQDVRVVEYDQLRRPVFEEDGTLDNSGVAALVHLKLFLGQEAEPGRPRRLFLADHGPFDVDARRFYAYATVANTFYFDEDFGGGVQLEGPGDLTIGGGAGVNLDRHWGAEIHMVVNEPALGLAPFGNFQELSVFSVLPTARFRWPLLAGRLVPFATAGIGVAFLDLNDRSQIALVTPSRGAPFLRRDIPTTRVDDTTLAGAVGLGLEYFLNHHVSVSGGATFYLYSAVTTRVQQVGRAPTYGTVDPSGIAPMLRLTAYLP